MRALSKQQTALIRPDTEPDGDAKALEAIGTLSSLHEETLQSVRRAAQIVAKGALPLVHQEAILLPIGKSAATDDSTGGRADPGRLAAQQQEQPDVLTNDEALDR